MRVDVGAPHHVFRRLSSIHWYKSCRIEVPHHFQTCEPFLGRTNIYIICDAILSIGQKANICKLFYDHPNSLWVTGRLHEIVSNSSADEPDFRPGGLKMFCFGGHPTRTGTGRCMEDHEFEGQFTKPDWRMIAIFCTANMQKIWIFSWICNAMAFCLVASRVAPNRSERTNGPCV